MKKPPALLLAAGMTLGLAAYGNDSQGSSESPASGDETGGSSIGTVELNLWSLSIGGFAEAPDWEPTIAALSKQNPDIGITVTPTNYQDGGQKLTSIITTGTGPNIIFGGLEHAVDSYACKDLIVDLSGLQEADGSDTAEGISSVSQLDGTYYMYPLSAAAHRMVISYEAPETAGTLQYIDEKTRTWTTDNFVKAMEAVHNAAATGTTNINTPGITCCGTQDGGQGTRALVSNLCSDYFVSEDGTAYTANSENSAKALKPLQDMVNNGSMSTNVSSAAAGEPQAFADQARAVGFCWNYANYIQYTVQTQLTPFAMTFPFDDGKPELEMVGPCDFGVFNSKDEAKIEVTKKLVQFVCDDQTVGVEAVEAIGFFLIHSDWGGIYTGDAGAETRAPFTLMSDYLGHYYDLTGG